MLKINIIWFFCYLWILTPPSGLFWPFLAVCQGFTQFCIWGTLLGSNQCWRTSFGSIDFPQCKFQSLWSSGLGAAFLVLEFKINTFSILLGPNDPKKVKKLQKIYTIVPLAFDLALTTFMAFFGLFIAFWGLLMSKKSIRFICSYYLHSRTFWMKISKIGHSEVVKKNMDS